MADASRCVSEKSSEELEAQALDSRSGMSVQPTGEAVWQLTTAGKLTVFGTGRRAEVEAELEPVGAGVVRFPERF